VVANLVDERLRAGESEAGAGNRAGGRHA
jgi:hypothetical protein